MKFPYLLIAAAPFAMAPAAFAQTAAPQTTPAQQAPAAADPAQTSSAQAAPAQPAAAAQPATNASVTDTEVRQYAAAALAVDKIRKDTSIPEAEKAPKLVAAVQASGMDANRFNAISQAMASDQALNKRIQQAAAQQMNATPATTPASTPSM